MVLNSLQGIYRAVLSVAEQDELDTVESKQLGTQFGRCVCYSVLTFKCCNLLGVAQSGGQSLNIQRPCVDVRINTEISSGTVEECL